MSDTGPIAPAHRDAMTPNGNSGVIGAATRLGQSVISALPPAFLLLVLINCAFIGMVMYFLDDQLDQRTRLVNTLINKCMDIALHAPPPKERP